MSYSISHIPETERPRERFLEQGPDALATVELLALILGSGTKSAPVLQIAQELLTRFGSLQGLADATLAELRAIKGVGEAKAIQLKAIFALGARLERAPKAKISIDTPLHAYHFIKEIFESETREMLIAILQDVKNQLITYEIVSIGTLSTSLVHPREIFYPAIRHKAARMILVHNHPSGDPTPSKQDIEITKSLIEVAAMMEIPIQDHLIIGSGKYVSLRQQGIQFNGV